MTITEKVAYVKGLVEGLDMDKKKPEVKVLSAVIELLDDMSLTVSDLEDSYDELVDQIDAVDEDLSLLEEDFYEVEDEDGEDDDVFYEVTCPTCSETICVSEPIILDGGIECPNCGENLEFDLDGISLSDNCECGCDCDSECDCTSDCDCEPNCECEPTCDCGC